ncbi:LPXTG cell wall anchor domain-containing protein [Microbacterium caowuchunii]|uniref:LPXTG cell wall anchor domain-containing protein n=1 Tax=Microbacterium caowuchunii TaxID=2614638 RepID=A0A5N0THH4_9MICO|nr:LPXTG cell wall anchor domain-containing protein [Microbacterium caowuchunii]KAA9133904.1 LPXTG cell wall anchor domain-containing protein [Microbacterium caowuchunii]
MKSLRTKIAAVVIAAAAMIAAPAAASANSYNPVAPGGGQVVAPGGTITVPFTGFAPNEQVTFTLTGENAAGATLAVVKAAVNSTSIVKTASGSGAASVSVTLPANASGTYTLTGVGATSNDPISVTITVSSTAGGGSGLPATGVDSASLMGVWIGGGVLLLGGLAVTVFAVRRQRQDA